MFWCPTPAYPPANVCITEQRLKKRLKNILGSNQGANQWQQSGSRDFGSVKAAPGTQAFQHISTFSNNKTLRKAAVGKLSTEGRNPREMHLSGYMAQTRRYNTGAATDTVIEMRRKQHWHCYTNEEKATHQSLLLWKWWLVCKVGTKPLCSTVQHRWSLKAKWIPWIVLVDVRKAQILLTVLH